MCVGGEIYLAGQLGHDEVCNLDGEGLGSHDGDAGEVDVVDVVRGAEGVPVGRLRKENIQQSSR